MSGLSKNVNFETKIQEVSMSERKRGDVDTAMMSCTKRLKKINNKMYFFVISNEKLSSFFCLYSTHSISMLHFFPGKNNYKTLTILTIKL